MEMIACKMKDDGDMFDDIKPINGGFALRMRLLRFVREIL
jgi:hypothetical protein